MGGEDSIRRRLLHCTRQCALSLNTAFEGVRGAALCVSRSSRSPDGQRDIGEVIRICKSFSLKSNQFCRSSPGFSFRSRHIHPPLSFSPARRNLNDPDLRLFSASSIGAERQLSQTIMAPPPVLSLGYRPWKFEWVILGLDGQILSEGLSDGPFGTAQLLSTSGPRFLKPKVGRGGVFVRNAGHLSLTQPSRSRQSERAFPASLTRVEVPTTTLKFAGEATRCAAVERLARRHTYNSHQFGQRFTKVDRADGLSCLDLQFRPHLAEA